MMLHNLYVCMSEAMQLSKDVKKYEIFEKCAPV